MKLRTAPLWAWALLAYVLAVGIASVFAMVAFARGRESQAFIIFSPVFLSAGLLRIWAAMRRSRVDWAGRPVRRPPMYHLLGGLAYLCFGIGLLSQAYGIFLLGLPLMLAGSIVSFRYQRGLGTQQ